MRKTSIAVAAVALALPAAAAAQVSTPTAQRYERDYHAVVAKLGTRAPGRNIIQDGLSTGAPVTDAVVMQSIGVLSRMLDPATTVHRVSYHAASTDGDGDHDGDMSDHVAIVHHAAHSTDGDGDHDGDMSDHSSVRASAQAPAPQAASTPVSSGGGYSSVPGVPAGFAACVAMRESGNGAGSSNIYGIIPASGYSVAGMSVAQQKQVFSQLYAKDGTAPWAPYDGC